MSNNIIDSIQLSGVTYGIKGSGGTETIELTQAQYDALVDKDPNVFYIITDAQAGDLTNYYTKTETNTLLGGKADTATTYTKTEVDTALGGKADTATTYTKTEVDNAITAATSTKQDTLVSGTNIKTINNESILGGGNIDIQGGGGKAIEAGRGIDITTGETADTINCTLPIISFSNKALKFGYYASSYTADTIGEAAMVGGGIGNTHNIATGTGSISLGSSTSATSISSVAFGGNNLSSGRASFAMGGMNNYSYQGNNAIGHSSFVGGIKSNARGNYSFAFGKYINANNQSEHSQGEYNVSNTGSTTADKTLFSVGNGTADNARHNAFEIRQNGDIYCSDGTNDVKLQDTITATAANTTALGGLKLVKLSQSEYDSLTTKDNSTLYVIVN